MKHLFLVNPAAGLCDRTAQIKAAANAVLGARGIPYAIAVSRGPGDLTARARAAAAAGDDIRLYACGGDGTLNEVVNGAVEFDNAAVTHFPAGSGNDFIKLFDQPDAFRDLQRLLDGCETHLDLILCKTGAEKRYGVNVCSLGLDARIGTQIAAYRRLPLVGGSSAYLLSTAVNVFRGIHQPYTIDFGARRIQGNQTLICVCNGCWYGGSFHPAPEARPDDGLLDVLLVKPVNLFRLATAIGHYKRGAYRRYPNLIEYCRTDRLHITCQSPSVVNLDGEAITSEEVSLSVAPRKLRFFTPQGVQLLSKARDHEIIEAI